jgi:hypothetical protein
MSAAICLQKRPGIGYMHGKRRPKRRRGTLKKIRAANLDLDMTPIIILIKPINMNEI